MPIPMPFSGRVLVHHLHLLMRSPTAIGLSLFENVVVVAFQSAFYLETYQNDVFLFFKNYF